MGSLLYRDLTFVASPPEANYITVVVKGFPLAVYSDGNVWDVRLGQWINTYVDKDGYLIANKAQTSIKIHRLMLFVYEGAPARGYECRHLDGDPANNEVSNLMWGTKKDNRADRLLHGTHNARSDHGRTKFTEDDVADIKRRLSNNESLVDIAHIYEVTSGTISHIKQKRTWNNG